MAVLAVVPSPAVTAAPLYVIEDRLAALIETAELVSVEQEQEFRAEFQAALTAASVDKRDRAGQFLAHLEQQIDFAKFEIDRLRQRKATCERALERLENYVIGTIENLGTDGKGKYRRLEGKTTTFSLRACPPSVEVADETAIPSEYKMLLLKLPAVMWEQLLDGLEVEQRSAVLGQLKSPEVTVDKRSIKAAIDAGVDVPGASLAIGRHSLRRS
jgi:Siphovirus Gp157